MAGLLRGAVSDLAETLRRVFRDPPSAGVDLALARPGTGTVPFPSAQAQAPSFRLEAEVGRVPTLEPRPPLEESFTFEARLNQEEGWADWEAGARICVLPLLQAEGCARLEVPGLPRRAETKAVRPEAFRTRSRMGLEALPGIRSEAAGWSIPAPRARRALEHALALPLSFQSEDIPKISKALWMRYTLKLVKETGQNIRNLEVLGLYRIPRSGTRSINHQAATGRLLVTLGPEAQGSPRSPFILARRKDDGSIVCSFVEDA